MNPQIPSGRIAVSILSLTLLVAVVACGGSSPMEPALPDLSAPAALAGQSVITGVVSGGGNFASGGMRATAISASNVQVSVEGTGISTRTNTQGHFRLVNVPSGTLSVRFNSSEANAMVTVPGVGGAQHVDLMVQLQPSSAIIAHDEREELDKFESLVVSVVMVDLENGTVELADGKMIGVDGVTWWDTGGDYFNLTDLNAAVLAGTSVEAKGQGTFDPESGQILASVIRVKAAEAEFEGVVQSASGADPDGTIFLVANLKGGVAEVRVDGATVWDPNGDLVNLTDVLAAFTKGLLINVEGKGALDAAGTFILAGEIKAELVERDFEGIVASAGGTAPDGTIILVFNAKGPITTILVDANTVWEGDALSLTALIAALAGPFPVKVEGEGWMAADETFILATKIKVEIQDDEDNVCDGRYTAQVAAIDELIDLAEEIAEANGFNGGQTNSFVSKLKNAAKSLEKCNATPAANQLGAFINEVNAFVGSGKLLAADGALLVSAAQAIIDAINAAG